MTAARLPRVVSAVGDTDTVMVFVGGDPAVAGMATKAALLDDITVADDLTVTDDVTVGGDVVISGTLEVGSTDTERASIKGIYVSTLAVTVPSITDPDIAKVDVDISGLTFAASVGDIVIVTPTEALPSACRLQGAWVTATDTVQITYGSEGGNVTGASKTHKFLLIDLT